MRLSDLKTGEQGIIVKVTGYGGFRKRIVEMGFIRGKKVEVLLNAPLKDPIKYKIMGYEVSLRRSEAEMIEVVSEAEAEAALMQENARGAKQSEGLTLEVNETCDDEKLERIALKKHKVINIALVGNPNCGKTSLFNFVSGAHEHVGNYSGVTVDAKEGHATFEGYRLNLVDLPGTYSLSAYSPEELYVRKQLIEKNPDVVINVIDSSNLERNLYLTTQLIDMHMPMVCALNMFDETQKRGDHIDFKKLSELLGVAMLPTVFKTGEGVEALFHEIIQRYEQTGEQMASVRHIHINYGHEIEHGIAQIQTHLRQDTQLRLHYSTRYLAIKLLEKDADTTAMLSLQSDFEAIKKIVDVASQRVLEETGVDSETAIMDAKYGFIHGALEEVKYSVGKEKDTYQTTHLLDKFVTHRVLGFPIFLLMLLVMFSATFTLGQIPMDWIDAAVGELSHFVSMVLPDGPVKDLLVDGVLGGVGAVIVFLPQILILYFFISFMEDSGYMARAAFIMDKLMHKMGLHGKSFIPLIMGFGCNVPAMMATRTIESRRSRIVTMLILPLMSCSARLPIYIMITGAFFPAKYRALVMVSLYFVGIALAVLLSRLFGLFLVKGNDTPFVMELPPYRFPTWKAIGRHTWEKGKQYLKKMGGIILVASILVWALGYFPHDDTLSDQQQQEQSYIGRIGKLVEPVFRPQGFDWKLDVGLLSGVGAKEIVASTMGVLYSGSDEVANADEAPHNDGRYMQLRQQMTHDIARVQGIPVAAAEPIATLTAYCFLLFVLLYFPCIATIAAIKGETGSWRWALFAAGYTTALAWVVSAVVFQIGRCFI